MQAESVAGLACCKTVLENACQVLRGNTDTVVFDLNPNPVRDVIQNLQGDDPFPFNPIAASVFGVVDQVEKNLQHGVLVYGDRWY